MKLSIPAVTLAATLYTGAITQAAPAQTANQDTKPAIVLVHGAYADGTSWSKVIALLQAKGYQVVSVQNPTTSLADDVTATERVIEQQTRPVVLVGHSWAGVVITQAGNNSRVKALVYVDASAPDGGQSISDAAAALPAAPGASAGVKDKHGFLTLPEAAVRKYFAQDLSHADQGIIAATQTPWAIGCLTDKVTQAAWRNKPSWWVIGENDQMISPKLQERMAAQMKAKVTKLPTSHLAMLVDPKGVTDIIIDAANKVQSGKINTLQAPVTELAPIRDTALNPPATVEPTGFEPVALVPLAAQPPARIIVDAPHSESLAVGRVVIRYRAENLRIMPVYGPIALNVSPRIGHLHITVDDGPWRWVDASGEPLIINKLTPGPHKVLVELVDPTHMVIDSAIVDVVVPQL